MGERGADSVSTQRIAARWVGVKIYEPVDDTSALFADWKRLGIDTALVGAELAARRPEGEAGDPGPSNPVNRAPFRRLGRS